MVPSREDVGTADLGQSNLGRCYGARGFGELDSRSDQAHLNSGPVRTVECHQPVATVRRDAGFRSDESQSGVLRLLDRVGLLARG